MRSKNIKSILKSYIPLLIILAIYFGVFFCWFAFVEKVHQVAVDISAAELCYIMTMPLFSAFYGCYSCKKTGHIILPQILYGIVGASFYLPLWALEALSIFWAENYDMNVLNMTIIGLIISFVFAIITKLIILIIKLIKRVYQKIKASRTKAESTSTQQPE